MKKIWFLAVILIPLISKGQDLASHKIYKSNGEEVKYETMISELKKADVCFFGEIHNNPVSHWFEFEIMKDLFDIFNDDLILGAEMFERDQQLILNEYLNGIITAKKFESGIKLWPNYETDYKQLVDFAAEKGIEFIATNIPRRYASIVHKEGFEGLKELSGEAKKFVPPLPVPYDKELKSYADMLKMGGMMHKANPNLPKAQAIKDATMAYSISESMKDNSCFLHFNGKYHSQYKEGIVWYLNKYIPDLKVKTITTIQKDKVASPDEETRKEADYIIVVDSHITGSY